MAGKFAGLTSKLRTKLLKRKSLKIWIRLVSQYLLFPVLCWLALEMLPIFLTHLTEKPITIIDSFFLPSVRLFFYYRLIALLITLFLGQEIYASLISKFLLPVFVIYLIIQFLGLFTDVSVLSRTEILNLSGTSITIRGLFIASLGLYIWFAGINGIAQFYRKLMIERFMVDKSKLDAYLILIRYFLVGLGILIAFRELNLDPTAIAAISGGLAVGLGFGLKDILTNFISGIILLFERSIRPGDVIEFEGSIGSVQEVNLRSTSIKTEDDIEYVIPNQQFLTNTLKSYTRRNRRVKYSFPISLYCAYKPEDIIKIILEAISQEPNILVNLTSTVEVETLGAKNVYNVRIWLDDHLDIKHIRSEIYRRIMIVFNSYGIDLDPPVPYSLMMVKESPSLEPTPVSNPNTTSLPEDSLTEKQKALQKSTKSKLELIKYSFETI